MSTNGRRSTTASRTVMQPSDAFFWYAEEASPEHRPLVGGLFLLDRAPDAGRVRAAFERLTLMLPRLRQRIAPARFGIGLPVWQHDEEFELDYHLREVILPQPATQRHLLHFAGEVFSTPLDHIRPLWEAHLVTGLEGGRAGLFLKMHHAVMDGVGSVALFDVLMQAHRGDPVPPVSWRARRHAAASGPTPAAALAGSAAAAVRMLADPMATFRQFGALMRGASVLLSDLTATSPAAPANGHRAGIGRRLDGAVISLPRMKRIKSALGVPLNDLVLTAVAGALGRYHTRRGLSVDAFPCMVPMSLRQGDERGQPGNRVGGFTVHLPIGERDPLARLERIRAQTQAAKSGGHGATYQFLMQATALLPAVVMRGITQSIAGRVQLICSNVPGPAEVHYLGGAKVEAVYPFAPVIFGAPLSIALVSYGPTLGVGISADPAVVPDPERLRRYLELEIDAIERRVGTPRERRRAAARRRAARA